MVCEILRKDYLELVKSSRICIKQVLELTSLDEKYCMTRVDTGTVLFAAYIKFAGVSLR